MAINWHRFRMPKKPLLSPMRLRFTIRDLLWLTLVVALAVGWWQDRRNIMNEWSQFVSLSHLQPELRQEVRRLEDSISFWRRSIGYFPRTDTEADRNNVYIVTKAEADLRNAKLALEANGRELTALRSRLKWRRSSLRRKPWVSIGAVGMSSVGRIDKHAI